MSNSTIEPLVVASHSNSEAERITIERANTPAFEGQYLLVIHDDPRPRGPGVRAPMLLDEGTRMWLKEQIAEIERAEHDDCDGCGGWCPASSCGAES